MRLIIIFISYVSSHPTYFWPSLAHHQGCPELLFCYNLVLVIFVGCPCVRGGGLAVRHPQHTQTGSNSSTIAADNSML
jgi:hypothetical protein